MLTMSKVLLREYYELCEGGVCQDMLTEAEKKYVANGGMILTGKLQEAEVLNGNGRTYPRKILEREIIQEELQKQVKEENKNDPEFVKYIIESLSRKTKRGK